MRLANHLNLADQPHMQSDDELEGMERAPYGSRNPDDPDRNCISEVSHKGRHSYRPIDRLVN